MVVSEVFGYEHDFCQAEKAGNTDPRTNYAVKYATARGHPIQSMCRWRHVRHLNKALNIFGEVSGHLSCRLSFWK